MVTLLKELATDHDATIMVVTHDRRIVEFADRVVNMVDGRIISGAALGDSAPEDGKIIYTSPP